MPGQAPSERRRIRSPTWARWLEYPQALFSLSYGANGVIFALLAAEIDSRRMPCGAQTRMSRIFRFDR